MRSENAATLSLAKMSKKSKGPFPSFAFVRYPLTNPLYAFLRIFLNRIKKMAKNADAFPVRNYRRQAKDGNGL